MRRRSVLAVVFGLLVAGCGSAARPSPAITPTAAPAASPTAGPSAAPSTSETGADPFAGQPYVLKLPAGWVAYDPSNPANKVTLDAMATANPGFAASIRAFESLPNVRMAVNGLLGNILLVIPTASGGLPVATIAQNLTAQFEAVPGVITKPVAESLTLPAGDARHWALAIAMNKVGGGSLRVDESIYLVTNAQTALIVEFVTPHGGAVPDEPLIIETLRFRP